MTDVREEVPPPDPVVVLLANLFGFAGLGYLMLRQKEKAIIVIALWLIVAYPTCFAASLLIAAVAAVDGWMQARHRASGLAIGPVTMFGQHASRRVECRLASSLSHHFR